MKQLNIVELESFIRLCDRKKEILYRKISSNVSNSRELNDEYTRLFEIADKLDAEFDQRLEKLAEDA